MMNRIRTGEPRGFNKGRSSKFRVGFRVRQTPEEGRMIYGPKRCGNNTKDEDNSPKTLNDKNLTHFLLFFSVGSGLYAWVWDGPKKEEKDEDKKLNKCYLKSRKICMRYFLKWRCEKFLLSPRKWLAKFPKIKLTARFTLFFICGFLCISLWFYFLCLAIFYIPVSQSSFSILWSHLYLLPHLSVSVVFSRFTLFVYMLVWTYLFPDFRSPIDWT